MPVSSPINFSKSIDYASLKDRNVLLTGGASGFGKAFVQMFAKHGANVVFGDVQDSAAKELEALGNVKFVHCDVTSFESQVNFLREALAFFPRNEVDVYIPNAGILPPATQIAPQDPAELANLTSVPADLRLKGIDINLKAVYLGTMLVTRYGMGLHKGPSAGRTKTVILISSLAGYCGAESSDEYTASKFGVRGFFRGLRKQAAGLGVRLNLVAPFYAETPMTVLATPVLKSVGIPVITIDQVVSAVSILATDEDVWGRSLFIMPEGLSDGGDDSQGLQGGKSFSTQAFGEHWAVLVNGPMSDEIPA